MFKKKFDIFKTFEIFNSEAISIIKDRIIKFVFLETDNLFSGKSSIITDVKDEESAQITVVNNEKVYNLLENTWKRHQKKLENEDIKC